MAENVPTTTERAAIAATAGAQSSCSAGKAAVRMRARAAKPAIFTPADIMGTAAAGAP